MIEYLLIILCFSLIGIGWFVSGLFNDRHKKLEEELDEWSGVYDVKREVDNRLSDDSERERLRDKYNSK